MTGTQQQLRSVGARGGAVRLPAVGKSSRLELGLGLCAVQSVTASVRIATPVVSWRSKPTKSKLISAWNTRTARKRSSKQSQNQTDEVGTLLGRESFGFPLASYYPGAWFHTLRPIYLNCFCENFTTRHLHSHNRRRHHMNRVLHNCCPSPYSTVGAASYVKCCPKNRVVMW